MTRIPKNLSSNRKRAPLKTRAPRQNAPKSRQVDHRSLCICTLRRVRALDNGDPVALVELDDGTERVIRFDERFWVTRITDMLQAHSAPTRKRKPAKPDAEDDTEPRVAPDEGAEDADGPPSCCSTAAGISTTATDRTMPK